MFPDYSSRRRWHARLALSQQGEGVPSLRLRRIRMRVFLAACSPSIFCDDAEEAMLFIGNAGGEIDPVAQRKQVPQAVELERRPILGA